MNNATGGHAGREIVLRAVLPSVLLALAVGIPSVLILRKAGPPQRSRVDPRPLVVTSTVAPATGSFEIITHGTVVPKREVTVAAEVAGKIVRVTDDCNAGRFVKAGALLAEIDPTRYELEIRKLDSEVKQIQVDLLQHDLEKENTERLVAIAEEDQSIAQRELERVEGLMRTNSASASERDQAISSVMRYKNALQQLQNTLRLWSQKQERLKAQLELTQTRVRLAKLDLEKTKVVAPIDGFITEDLVEESTYAQPGMALCKIEDREAVEVRCSLKLDDLFWLAESKGREVNDTAGLEATLYRAPRVPAVIQYRVAGKTYQWDDCYLSRYEGTGVDEKTRTVPCRIEVPHPDKGRLAGDLPPLVRGMFVTARLLATPRPMLLEVPYAALRPNNEIWVVRGDELRILRPRVAKMLEETVLIHGADLELKPGEEIVVSPLSVAVDRMKVRRVSGDSQEPAAVQSGGPPPGKVQPAPEKAETSPKASPGKRAEG